MQNRQKKKLMLICRRECVYMQMNETEPFSSTLKIFFKPELLYVSSSLKHSPQTVATNLLFLQVRSYLYSYCFHSWLSSPGYTGLTNRLWASPTHVQMVPPSAHEACSSQACCSPSQIELDTFQTYILKSSINIGYTIGTSCHWVPNDTFLPDNE